MYDAQTLSQIKMKFLELMPIPKLYTLSMNAGCSAFFFKAGYFQYTKLVHSQNNPSFVVFNIAIMAYYCQVKKKLLHRFTVPQILPCVGAFAVAQKTLGLPRFP